VLRNPNAASIPILSNAVQLVGSLTFNSPGSLTLLGNVSGAGSINLVGPGVLRLSGSTSYTGTTTFNSGASNSSSKLTVDAPSIGAVNFIGPGGGELIFKGLTGATGTATIQTGASALLGPGTDVTTVTAGNLAGGGTLMLGFSANTGTVVLGGTNTNNGP